MPDQMFTPSTFRFPAVLPADLIANPAGFAIGGGGGQLPILGPYGLTGKGGQNFEDKGGDA